MTRTPPTGTLYDAQDNILVSNCNPAEAEDWLRDFDGRRGWRGGQTTWLADDGDESVTFKDADGAFAGDEKSDNP